MSAAPAGGAAVPENKPGQMFKSCWSCSVISGGGLVLSGAYVFLAARKVTRQGASSPLGTVAQLMFAAGLVSWGVVILADPIVKFQKKT